MVTASYLQMLPFCVLYVNTFVLVELKVDLNLKTLKFFLLYCLSIMLLSVVRCSLDQPAVFCP